MTRKRGNSSSGDMRTFPSKKKKGNASNGKKKAFTSKKNKSKGQNANEVVMGEQKKDAFLDDTVERLGLKGYNGRTATEEAHRMSYILLNGIAHAWGRKLIWKSQESNIKELPCMIRVEFSKMETGIKMSTGSNSLMARQHASYNLLKYFVSTFQLLERNIFIQMLLQDRFHAQFSCVLSPLMDAFDKAHRHDLKKKSGQKGLLMYVAGKRQSEASQGVFNGEKRNSEEELKKLMRMKIQESEINESGMDLQIKIGRVLTEIDEIMKERDVCNKKGETDGESVKPKKITFDSSDEEMEESPPICLQPKIQIKKEESSSSTDEDIDTKKDKCMKEEGKRRTKKKVKREESDSSDEENVPIEKKRKKSIKKEVPSTSNHQNEKCPDASLPSSSHSQSMQSDASGCDDEETTQSSTTVTHSNIESSDKKGSFELFSRKPYLDYWSKTIDAWGISRKEKTSSRCEMASYTLNLLSELVKHGKDEFNVFEIVHCLTKFQVDRGTLTNMDALNLLVYLEKKGMCPVGFFILCICSNHRNQVRKAVEHARSFFGMKTMSMKRDEKRKNDDAWLASAATRIIFDYDILFDGVYSSMPSHIRRLLKPLLHLKADFDDRGWLSTASFLVVDPKICVWDVIRNSSSALNRLNHMLFRGKLYISMRAASMKTEMVWNSLQDCTKLASYNAMSMLRSLGFLSRDLMFLLIRYPETQKDVIYKLMPLFERSKKGFIKILKLKAKLPEKKRNDKLNEMIRKQKVHLNAINKKCPQIYPNIRDRFGTRRNIDFDLEAANENNVYEDTEDMSSDNSEKGGEENEENNDEREGEIGANEVSCHYQFYITVTYCEKETSRRHPCSSSSSSSNPSDDEQNGQNSSPVKSLPTTESKDNQVGGSTDVSMHKVKEEPISSCGEEEETTQHSRQTVKKEPGLSDEEESMSFAASKRTRSNSHASSFGDFDLSDVKGEESIKEESIESQMESFFSRQMYRDIWDKLVKYHRIPAEKIPSSVIHSAEKLLEDLKKILDKRYFEVISMSTPFKKQQIFVSGNLAVNLLLHLDYTKFFPTGLSVLAMCKGLTQLNADWLLPYIEARMELWLANLEAKEMGKASQNNSRYQDALAKWFNLRATAIDWICKNFADISTSESVLKYKTMTEEICNESNWITEARLFGVDFNMKGIDVIHGSIYFLRRLNDEVFEGHLIEFFRPYANSLPLWEEERLWSDTRYASFSALTELQARGLFPKGLIVLVIRMENDVATTAVLKAIKHNVEDFKSFVQLRGRRSKTEVEKDDALMAKFKVLQENWKIVTNLFPLYFNSIIKKYPKSIEIVSRSDMVSVTDLCVLPQAKCVPFPNESLWKYNKEWGVTTLWERNKELIIWETRKSSEMDRLTEKIEMHFEDSYQQESDWQRKAEMKSTLEKKLEKLLSEVESTLIIIGSSNSPLSAYNSNLDLAVFNPKTPFIDVSFLQKLMEALAGSEALEIIVTRVQFIMKSSDGRKIETRIWVDPKSIYMAHLYTAYSVYDSCGSGLILAKLLLYIKHWKLVDEKCATMGVDSYELTSMLIHYLQCGVSPPVLPCLNSRFHSQLYPEVLVLKEPISQPWNLPPLSPCRNEQSLASLLLGFFVYYSAFDFDNFAISIREGHIIKKTTINRPLSHLTVQHPYNALLGSKNGGQLIVAIRSSLKELMTEFKLKSIHM